MTVIPKKMAPFFPDVVNAKTDKAMRLLKKYGADNIHAVIKEWLREESSLNEVLQRLNAAILSLEGKGVADFKTIATEHECPSFPIIQETAKGVIPVDEASIKRQMGATTCNVCGWCDYLVGKMCSLIPEFSQEEKGVRFDTPCRLTSINDEELERYHKGLRWQREAVIQKKDGARLMVLDLIELVLTAEQRPVLCPLRTVKHFAVGDSVYCFMANKLVHAVVTEKDADGFLKVYADKKPRNLTYHVTAPTIILERDYDFFCEHEEFLNLWLQTADYYHADFDSKRFKKALSQGQVIIKERKVRRTGDVKVAAKPAKAAKAPKTLKTARKKQKKRNARKKQ